MKQRRQILLENLDFFESTTDTYFVLPSPRGASGDDRVEVVRVVSLETSGGHLRVH